MRQCPKCELRFSTADELDDHLATDHGIAPEQLPDRRNLGLERPEAD
jgi:hypothetical protein